MQDACSTFIFCVDDEITVVTLGLCFASMALKFCFRIDNSKLLTVRYAFTTYVLLVGSTTRESSYARERSCYEKQAVRRPFLNYHRRCFLHQFI